jgi:EmrB/QacA subfamily drug resistance transporter
VTSAVLAHNEARAPARHPRRWAALGVLLLCVIVMSLDNTILNVALKTIQQDLGGTQSQMEWAINSYSLVFAGLLFTFGVLGDRWGRTWVMLAGLLVFGAASVASAFVTSPDALIVTRGAMGVGAAAIPSLSLSIITNLFPSGERGRAIGIWSAAMGLGVGIGPVAGGFLLEHWWWGSIFLVNVPIVALAVAGTLLIVPNSKDPSPGRLDPAGVVLSIAGLLALVYGIIRAGDRGDWLRADVLGPVVGGLVLLVVFAVHEWRSDHPALDVRLFRHRAFSAAGAALMLVFFALMGIMFFLAYYLQAVRDASPLRAGALLLPAAGGIMLTSAVSAPLTRRLGSRLVCTAGMLVTSAGFAAFALVGRHTETWRYELVVLAVGMAIGLVMAPATEVLMARVPPERAGAGAAVNSTVRQVGGALGVAVLGSVLATTYRRRVGDATDVLPAGQRHGAGDSIATTLTAIEHTADAARHGRLPLTDLPALRQTLPALADTARDAYVTAMHATALWAAAFTLLGAIVCLVGLPGRARRTGAIRPAGQAEPAGRAGTAGGR